jgi:broad specificity phosphatase PhoE
MSLAIYFLRHGETASSKANSFCGSSDPGLTEAGFEMAKEFAEAYKSLPFEAVFSSPLKRAVLTAEPVCTNHKIQMLLDDGLKEIAFGQWEGKIRDEVEKTFHDDYIWWLADPGWNAPTQGEKGIEIARRSSHVLERIEQTYSSGNVLVVSHKATIRIMLCSLLGIDVGRFRDRFQLPVGSISIVDMTANGPSLRLMNDRSYMSRKLRERPGT